MAYGQSNCWPTITAHVGFRTMFDEELELLVEHVNGIERRREYNGGYRQGVSVRENLRTPSWCQKGLLLSRGKEPMRKHVAELGR